MVRLVFGALPAIFVTLALFVLMRALITKDLPPPEEDLIGGAVDISRQTEDTEVQAKDRKPPKPVLQEAPPPPPTSTSLRTPKANESKMDINLDLGMDINANMAFARDADVQPIVRIPPQYPPRAQERGTEGWVMLRFDVTTAGTTENIVVVDADPPNTFNRAAKRAISRWKYKPMMVNGKATPRLGVEVILTFELDGDSR